MADKLILKNNVQSKIKSKANVNHIWQMLLFETALKFPLTIARKTGTKRTNLIGPSQMGMYKSSLNNLPNTTATRGARNTPQIIFRHLLERKNDE
jgi:hypothetical protein